MIDSTNPRVMADNIRELQTTVEVQGNAIEALGSYSETEVDTGMKDSDGNTIYRKVFKVEALPNNAANNIPHGVSNLGDVYRLSGVAQKGAGTGYPLNYKGSILLSYTSTNISIKTDSDFSSQGAILIFEYTKSAPAALNSPAPDDTRSIEPEEIPEDEYIEPEVRDPEALSDEIEQIPEPEVQEVKKTTRKKSTN